MARRLPPVNAEYTLADILTWLEKNGSAENVAGMSRFGINTDNAYGIGNTMLRPFAKTLGHNHQRANELWQTGNREARLLALFTAEPALTDPAQARAMTSDFNSWEIVDHAADLFVDAGHLDLLTVEFAGDDREFVRRTAFAMIAWGAVHLKKRNDADFQRFLPLIETYATDPRNYVKKAVNWALRQIGKRSLSLHGPALELASKLAASRDKTARWIGRNAHRELSAEKTLERLANKTGRK